MRTFSTRVVGFCLISGALGFNGLTSLYNTHEEPPIDSDDYKSTIGFTSKEKWIKQKLDHFNPQDSREWEMRYLENDRFWQPGERESSGKSVFIKSTYRQVDRFSSSSAENGKYLLDISPLVLCSKWRKN